MCWNREVGPDLRRALEEVGRACGGDSDSGDANTQLQTHFLIQTQDQPPGRS